MGLSGQEEAVTPHPGVVQPDKALKALHYGFPLIMLAYFLLSSSVAACLLKRRSVPGRNQTAVLKKVALRFGLGVIATYILQCVLAILRTLSYRGLWTPQHEVVYYIAAIISLGAIQLSLSESKRVVWQPYYGSWAIAIAFEAALLGLLCKSVSGIKDGYDAANIAIAVLRVILLFTLPASFLHLKRKQSNSRNGESDEERALLSDSASDTVYGSTGSDDESDHNKQIKERIRKKVEESGNWWNYTKSFAILWPMIWPGRDRKLQFIMGLVGVIFVLERGLNVLIPHQLGVITDSLATGSGQIPWTQVLLFVAFRFLNSESGLSALQGYLWIPIDQYSYKSISTTAFNHVMALSYDYHSEKKSGELYSAVSSGRSINWFVEMMLFNFFPMMADVAVAFVYFYVIFDAYMGLIVGFVLITYLFVTTRMGRYKESVRREYVAGMREETNLMWETLGSWQTVAYFNRTEYEQGRYSSIIDKLQRAAKKWQIGMTLLSGSQSLVLTVGLLSACFLAVYQISNGDHPVGAFVTLLTYWGQLAGPLSFFGSFMRRLQTTMIDAEKLLELLQQKPTVMNSPHAIPLQVESGEVAFNDVDFEYDERKPTISGVTFKARPGDTIAIVGETGAGKTTLLKLLFRFYDVKGGSIQIDGQNIKDVTIESLRENLGVVPQDPALFNDTIMSNLKYANFEASEEDVYAACRAAAIHDKILSFPDGYNSKVGERGVKLSGGELQRVAIARAILKNPKIVLLDEATSQVDLETEQQIQQAFRHLAENRTTFVVAHRLSTIMNAHKIIVLNEGRIIESGTHETLLAVQGKYNSLWSKHIKNESQGKPQETTSLMDDSPSESKNVKVSEQIIEVNQSDVPSDLSEAESGRGVGSKNSANDKIQEPVCSKDNNHAQAPTTTSSDAKESTHDKGNKSSSKNLPILGASEQQEHQEVKQIVPGSKPSLPKIRTSNLKPDAPEYIPAAMRAQLSAASTAPSPTQESALAADQDPKSAATDSSKEAGHSHALPQISQGSATKPDDKKPESKEQQVSHAAENIDQTAGGKGKRQKQQRNRQRGSRNRKELSNVSNEIDGQDTADASQPKPESQKKSKGNNNAGNRRRSKHKTASIDNTQAGTSGSEPASRLQTPTTPTDSDNQVRHASDSRGTGRRVNIDGNVKDKLFRRHAHEGSTGDTKGVPKAQTPPAAVGSVGKSDGPGSKPGTGASS